MTVTFTSVPGTEESAPLTIDLSNEEWCYYADENGGYGLYFYDQFDEGLYIGNESICPSAVYASELTRTIAILYNDGKYITSGEMPTHLRFVTDVDENGVITYAYWTADESLTYPAKVYILPISLEPELSALEIPIIYDATTRRISLPQGHDLYGGATTDVNSVKLSFTGIEPEGTNFIARVDFAVLVETGNRVVNRPFILLEQTADRWEAVIPNAILKATKDVHRLPIQLILANDSQVINSRNTIVLETTTAIDATASGDQIPDYEMPDWPLPTGVSESLDVLTLDVTYDPLTRMITLPDSDMYGGTTIDTNSVRINVTGIPAECDARLDFATAIRVDNSTVIKPFVVLDSIGTVFSAMIPQSVLMAAKETKKLPFQLVTRHGDTIINSRNTIVLEITRAINAMESVESAYTPYVMYRNDTWAWVSDFTYDTGAVVAHNHTVYVALQPSQGREPGVETEYWALAAPPGPQGPPGEVVSAGDVVVRYIGNGVDREFDVEHRLGTTKVIYSMQMGGQFINATVSVVDENTLHVRFHTPPLPNAVTMSIYSGGIVTRADQYIHEQDTPASTWNINHGKNRHVLVQIQDTTGAVIMGRITEVDSNNVKIEFNTAMAGTAIIE